MKEFYKKIHDALHHDQQNNIKINEKFYKIETTKGIRYIRINDQVFAQETTNENLISSQKKPITRIIRTGKIWGWISDNEIADPLLNND